MLGDPSSNSLVTHFLIHSPFVAAMVLVVKSSGVLSGKLFSPMSGIFIILLLCSHSSAGGSHVTTVSW